MLAENVSDPPGTTDPAVIDGIDAEISALIPSCTMTPHPAPVHVQDSCWQGDPVQTVEIVSEPDVTLSVAVFSPSELYVFETDEFDPESESVPLHE